MAFCRYPNKVLENQIVTELVKIFPALCQIQWIPKERCRDALRPEDQLCGNGFNIWHFRHCPNLHKQWLMWLYSVFLLLEYAHGCPSMKFQWNSRWGQMIGHNNLFCLSLVHHWDVFWWLSLFLSYLWRVKSRLAHHQNFNKDVGFTISQPFMAPSHRQDSTRDTSQNIY